MTAIAENTEIKRSGNREGTCAFDVIFPLIQNVDEPTYALSSHPVLEVWDDLNLNTVSAKAGDTKLFWATSGMNVGTAPDIFVGSAYRGIATSLQAGGSDWAANANQTSGIAFPAAGKGRCLKGNTDKLPLLPDTENFLGDSNTLMNRVSFNLAVAVHQNSSRTPGDMNGAICVRYTFLDQDPGCVVRGNTKSDGGEPSPTNITLLDHTDMRSIFGDDPDLIAGNRPIRPGQTSSSNTKPFINRPATGFVYSDKMVAGPVA